MDDPGGGVSTVLRAPPSRPGASGARAETGTLEKGAADDDESTEEATEVQGEKFRIVLQDNFFERF